MKKAVSLALALTLCLALAMPAFAAGEYELGKGTRLEDEEGSYGVRTRFTVDREPVFNGAEDIGWQGPQMYYTVSPDSVFTVTFTENGNFEERFGKPAMRQYYISCFVFDENGEEQNYDYAPKLGKFVKKGYSPNDSYKSAAVDQWNSLFLENADKSESPACTVGKTYSFKLPFDELGDEICVGVYAYYYQVVGLDPEAPHDPIDAGGYFQLYKFTTADVKQTDLLNIKFNDRSARMLDSGIAYSYTLTNNSDKAVNGYYALVAYDPKNSIWAYINSFDLTLGAGEKKSDTLVSGLWNMSRMKLVWVEFDDKAERDAFFADKRLFGGNGPYYSVNILDTKQWLQDALGITVNY